MTGIRERRLWEPGTRPSAASARAARALLARWGGGPGGIDLLVHAAVSRDRLEPATAAYVHRETGLGPATQIFDLSNACLGFLNALVVAGGLVDSGLAQRVLVASGENGRPLVEKTIERLLQPDLDRKGVKPFFANLTIGCGAVAALVSRADLVDRPLATLTAAVAGTDSSRVELCEGDTSADGALEMQTDSEALLDAGIALASRTWEAFLAETGGGHDLTVTHQVGATHQRRLREALSLDPARDHITYPWLGNTGSVACPLALADAFERGIAAPGMRLALLGIGSGLSSVMVELRT